MRHLRNYFIFLVIVMTLAGCSLLPARQNSATSQPSGEDAGGVLSPEATNMDGAAPDVQTTPSVEKPIETGDVSPVPKPKPVRLFRFTAEKGTPVLMPAFMHNELGCEWMGVGGQVFNAFDQPLIDLVVLLQGRLREETINLFSLTGTATAFGPGGYEFMLSNESIASERTLFIGLYDSYGNRLSPDVYFNTSGLCESNLVLINFREVYFEEGTTVFLPILSR